MNYQEALAYLYSLSDYERGGSYMRDRNENLPRERCLLEAVGNPHRSYSSTHIAGTKGKGSTAAIIERVLREAGLRTGLYTQPDLHTFRERIRINGQLISEEEVAQLVPELRAAVERIEQEGRFGPYITFEVATALAFLYFARRGVEHAVIEVGLGGRLDATNVIMPLVSVITSIGFDHMEVLGDTLTKIATEKAGIIKPRGTVVTSAQAPEALLAIAAVSERQQAELIRVGPAEGDPAQAEVQAGRLPPLRYRYVLETCTPQSQRFSVETPTHVYRELELSLLGQHQLENATAAIGALEVLRSKGIQWTEEDLRKGLRSVYWSARLEVIGQNPLVVVDGAHTAESMQRLIEALRETFRFRRLIVVLSTLRNKDIAGMVQALAGVDAVVITTVANPRSLSIEEIAAQFKTHAAHIPLYRAETSRQAMDLALQLAQPDDAVCAAGSLYLAGEVLRWAAAHGNQRVAATIEGVDHSG
ncbi:bifunctional folylpolyglutamate synthase/dihydrofolate synthase [Thermogemmatispora sp.]|uniref:bifunctional folylpolyglutamate synthase/dihydrofolate synthase n=1 Tax=Thermogemmatispora sp. TaxID=1968838 RepID=UPI001D7FBBBD|nr:folylpolyglutamate synthase/dihydrofolate synthase family protein [Thermogemmatispora sp.]MBX5450282.1 bifunctional folylpolyglutamate synthase/dihydrofolate synthase [Thermogemmatispora sp.]